MVDIIAYNNYTNHSSVKSQNTKLWNDEDKTYWNIGHCFCQTHKCGGVRSIKGIATLLSPYLQYIGFMTCTNEHVSKEGTVGCGEKSIYEKATTLLWLWNIERQ